MGKKRDFSKDILLCVKRLYSMEAIIKKWLYSAGKALNFEDIRKCFELNGSTSLDLPPHPLFYYKDNEKKVFLQCFDEPIKLPKRIMINVTWREVLDKLSKRRDMLRETIAMTKNSRFRNYHLKKTNNETNTRNIGHGSLRNRNLERTRNYSKGTSGKVRAKSTKSRPHPRRRKETRTRRHSPHRR